MSLVRELAVISEQIRRRSVDKDVFLGRKGRREGRGREEDGREGGREEGRGMNRGERDPHP